MPCLVALTPEGLAGLRGGLKQSAEPLKIINASVLFKVQTL